MGLFSWKKTKDDRSPEDFHTSEQASLFMDSSLVLPQAKQVSQQQVDNPRTEILRFLHQASKTCGLREFIHTYLFHYLNGANFVVSVEIKRDALQADCKAFLARWQLLQLGAMRFAQSKGIPLAAVYCHYPLDKASPLSTIEEAAMLGQSLLPQVQASLSEDAGEYTVRAMSASRFTPSRHEDTPSSIEVQESHDADLAREFFGQEAPPNHTK